MQWKHNASVSLSFLQLLQSEVNRAIKFIFGKKTQKNETYFFPKLSSTVFIALLFALKMAYLHLLRSLFDIKESIFK